MRKRDAYFIVVYSLLGIAIAAHLTSIGILLWMILWR